MSGWEDKETEVVVELKTDPRDSNVFVDGIRISGIQSIVISQEVGKQLQMIVVLNPDSVIWEEKLESLKDCITVMVADYEE